MKFQEIKQLIKVIEQSSIGEVEIEEEGLRVRISKNSSLTHTPPAVGGPAAIQIPQPVGLEPVQVSEAVVPAAPELGANISETHSPMVGTFYRSPAPDAEPYVEVGDRVKVGQTLCIIEAMKLMNEIQSEVSGRIVKVLVENSQPVEYDQVLFHIEKE